MGMIDVKIIKKAKQSGGVLTPGTGSGGGYAGGTPSGEAAEAGHALRADFADLAERANRAAEADHAKEADHAASARDLDSDSPAFDRFIRKDQDDRTPYQLASDVGFDVGQFLASVSGGRFAIDKVTGQSFLEVDRIFARVRAYFESLTVVERESLAGEQMVTPGGGVKCTSVEEVRNAQNVLTGWRCYFLSEHDGEKRETKIIAGDQAIAQTFNAKAGTANKVSNHRWWRLVTGVSNNAYTDDRGNVYGYIEVSATDCETDSDTPKEGDDVIQFGNRTDKTRQAAILISTVATDAPSIKLLTGIDHYSLVGKDIISQGYDAAKGHAYFRCYGDTYIGAPDGSTYVKYDVDSKKLTVKADLEVGSTIGGKDAESFVKDLIPEIPELTQEDIEDYVNNIVDPKIEGIQNQIDGVIETWFYNGVPTISNYPASDWNTDALKVQHLGDLYYDNDTGTAYRFSQKADKSYYWNVITDDAITKALKAAKDAQDTADGKRRTFTSQPTPPYDKGDIWVNATYPAGNTVKDAANGKYVNDILRCNTSRATGSFAIGDWGLASNYTDDTAALAAAQAAKAAKDAADAAQSAANAAQSSVTSLNNYVDGAFKDGIIDETEASGIANYINIVNADKERIDGTYQTLYANAYLSATGKASLKTAHDDVAAKITALINAINSAIADNKVTAAESAAVDSAFSAFSTSNKAFSAAVETANAEIQKTLKSAADAAKTAADNAKATAEAAQSVADAAKDRLDSWAADGVISPTEKQAIKDEIARIKGEKADIAAQYTKYGGTTPQAYLDAYTAYYNQLVALSASTPENITIPATFATNQTQYYTQRTVCVKAIADLASAYADKVAKEEATKATDPFKYLKENLLNAQKESTEISGGLIIATMMGLGYTENGARKLLAGMNGSYNTELGGRTIASWYGGNMLDLFDKNDVKKTTLTGQEATSLIRMDGSAYFLNGDIQFRSDRTAIFGSGATAITISNGSVKLGNGILIDIGGEAKGLGDSIASVTTLVNALSNVLVPVNSSGTRVAWDSADLWAVKSVKGFYSEEFVSARGQNGQSSSISKYLTDLLDTAISAPISGQALVYNGSKWVNQAIQTGLDTTQLANYLTTNNYAKKSDIPSLSAYMNFMVNPNYVNASFSTTELSKKAKDTYIEFWDGGESGWFNFQTGYLIAHGKVQGTTIVKEGGTSNQFLKADGSVDSNTYLTSHQSLANYYTKSEVDTKDKRLTTYYASRPTSANVNFGNNAGLYTFLATVSMTTGKPTEGDSHILHMEWDNSLSWAGQIALPTASTKSMQWRYQSGTAWQAWQTLLDTSNFNSLIGSNLTAYVKKAGDTMTGVLTLKGSMYEDAYNGALNMANSDIYGLNSFYTSDLADSSAEGMHFYRDATHVDTIWVSNGVMRFVPNRALGNSAAGNVIWHAGNDGSGSGLDADLLDGHHNGDLTAKFFNSLESATWDCNNPTHTLQSDYGSANRNIENAPSGWNYGQLFSIGRNRNFSNSLSAQFIWDVQHGTDNGGILWFRTKDSVKGWKSWQQLARIIDTVANANSLGGVAASRYARIQQANDFVFAGNEITLIPTGFTSSNKVLWLNYRCGTDGANADFNKYYMGNGTKGGVASVVAASFIRNGGTSSQFLKADGSVDATPYLSRNGGTMANTNVVTNLNADLLDGYHATSFARLSSANATVGASNRPVYLNAGTVTAVSSVGEAFLSWGGQNYSGNFGPLDAAISTRLGANRLAFANPNGTTFQYSTNGGSSWTDYGLTATQKRGFFDGAVGATLTAGKAANGAMTTNHQLRVIINTSSAQIYTVLNKFIINVSTEGVSGLTVTIERALQSTPTSFVTAASNIPLSGWSGFNVVNVTEFTTYGNVTTSQYGVIRFTFKCTGAGTNKNPFYIYSIMGFGGMGWTTPSNMALNGHLYSYDGDQNAVFPAKVTATSFAGSLSGNASSATQLQTARTLWGQSFNGTGNVSGNMTNVGDITTTAANGRKITCNGTSHSWGLHMGTGGENRGIYEFTSGIDKWLLYFDNSHTRINHGGLIAPNGISSTSIKIELDVNNATTGMSGEINRFGAPLYLQHRGANATSPTGNLLMVCNGGNVGIGTTSPSRKLHVNGDIQTSSIYASNWLRTTGNTGWYSESYGGGWYMNNSSWVKAYNKPIYCEYVQAEGCSGFGVGMRVYSASHTSIEVQGGNYTMGLGCHSNGGWYWWRGTNGSASANKSYVMEYNGSLWNFHGTLKTTTGIYSDGYVSARGQNTSSDERLKNILRPLSLNVRDIAAAPSVEFVWKKDGIKDVGSIAQYWRKLIPQLAPDMPDGSMGLQYGKTALMSVIAVARKTVNLEERVAQLERENRELKSQISQLKTQLA